MKAVMLEVPEHLLQERRRLGHDRWDEMWHGELHMVPPPSDRHQRLEYDLILAFDAPARSRGIVGSPETGVFRPGAEQADYRVPDLVYASPEFRAQIGVVGRAELVIEVRSPGDETYDKLPFYADLGCREVLVIDRDTLGLELFVDGERQPPATSYRLDSLGVAIAVVDGPRLSVSWEGTETEIVPA